MPVTDSNEEVVLKSVPYIYYPVWFQKSQEYVRALLENGSEVNVINPIFTRKLGFHIQKTNIGAQKIDGSVFKTFGMVIVNF